MEYYLRGGGLGNVHQYAEAHAILHQLIHADGGQKRLREFWDGFRSGGNGVKLFYKIFASTKLTSDDRDKDIERWSRSIATYVKIR